MRSHLSSASGGRVPGRLSMTKIQNLAGALCAMLLCALALPPRAAAQSEFSRYDISGPLIVSPPRSGDAHFTPDGRWLEFAGPAVKSARAGWSVDLTVAGRPVTLSSASAPTARLEQNQTVTRSPRYALTRESVARIADSDQGIEFELRLLQMIDAWGFTLTGRLTNRGAAPVTVEAINLLQTDLPGAELRLSAPAAAWLASPAIGKGFPPKTLSLLAGSPVESPSLALFRPAGPGLFIQATGAFFEQSRFVIRLSTAPEGALPLRAVWQGGMQVAPQASIVTEELEVNMDPTYEQDDPPLAEAP